MGAPNVTAVVDPPGGLLTRLSEFAAFAAENPKWAEVGLTLDRAEVARLPELLGLGPQPDARCMSCGCTEARACPVRRNGVVQGCAWVLLDRAKGRGLCSACATLPQLLFALLPLADPLGSEGALRAFGVTVRELAEYTGRTRRQLRRVLRDMRGRGLATSERVGKKLTWYRAEVI